MERRYFAANTIKVEKREAQDYPICAGYAATFDTFSENLGGFIETINYGFFREAIKPDNLEAFSLFNHDPNLVLGATKNGEVLVQEDRTGLYQETMMKGDTSISNDVRAHIEAGRIYKMSFAFTMNQDGDRWEIDGTTNKRVLLPGGCQALYDVSPVTYPAYSSTSVGMRSLIKNDKELDLALTALVRVEKNLPTTKDDVSALKNFRDRADAYLQRVDAPTQEEILQLRRRIFEKLA